MSQLSIEDVLKEIDSIGNEHSPPVADFLKSSSAEKEEMSKTAKGFDALCSALEIDETEVKDAGDQAVQHMVAIGAFFVANEGSVGLESLLRAMFLRAFFAGVRYQQKRDENEPTP